ncbi:MAG: Sulfur transfer protein involved in thiamine biosynthesis [Cyanobacteriota bacterium]
MTNCLIWLNGEQYECGADLLLPDLLIQKGYQPRLVVVELNAELLPRGQWAQQKIKAGDRLEVVTIVGGG